MQLRQHPGKCKAKKLVGFDEKNLVYLSNYYTGYNDCGKMLKNKTHLFWKRKENWDG